MRGRLEFSESEAKLPCIKHFSRVTSILLVRFSIVIALKAVRLVGFWASVLAKESISQDCHCSIRLAGGDSLASASCLASCNRSAGVLRLGACSVFEYWIVVGLPSLVKVLAILPTPWLNRTLKSLTWTNWDARFGSTKLISWVM